MRDDSGECIEEDRNDGAFVRIVEAFQGPQAAKNALLSDLISDAQARRSGLTFAEPPEPHTEPMPEQRPDFGHREILCDAGIHRIYRYDSCRMCEAQERQE